MSNIGKRQLGSNQKAFKYQFTLEILKYRCQVPVPCALKFMWKRNNKSIETKNQIAMTVGIINDLAVNQKLSSISTIIYNMDKKEFLSKESELVANMLFSGSPKKLASCQIDMRNILDSSNYRANRAEIFEVSMNPHVSNSKENRITFRLSSIYKQEIVCSEKSLGNGSLNMSGLSIPQDTKYFQKRYDAIPSKDNKDTHSVTSYNPNRYPSAKRQRDDSSSIRKFDYGYLAGLKSNLSNTNDLQGKSAKKSVDNKTQMNEGTYNNRQLVDEQNKRSKAEAELTKNKVEIQELKKKVGELVIDNLQLKQQNKRTAIQKSKEEASSFQHKFYELNNELRSTRAQLDHSNQEFQRLEIDFKSIKNDKLYLESQLQKRQKRIEQLQKNQLNSRVLQSIQNQNSDLKFQVDNLRRFIEQLKRQGQQKQSQLLNEKYRQSQEINSRLESYKKQNQKLRSTLSTSDVLQKKLYELEEELKEKLNELTTKTRYIIEIEKELEEYKNRLTQYETEKVFMQREIIKLKQESSDRRDAERNRGEFEARMERLQLESGKLAEQVGISQQIIDEKQRTIIKLEQEKSTSQGKSSRLLVQTNQIQKKSNELQTENRTLRQRITRLQLTNSELSDNLTRIKEDSSKQMMSSTISPETDRMFRESLQLQVEIKFANDQLIRLKNIEEAYQNERWKAEKQTAERQSIETDFQKIQKELVSKNRSLMIEFQKTKMMNQQLKQFQYNYDLLRDQLQKNRNIIYSGQQQVTHMEQVIIELEGIRTALQQQNNQLKNQKHMLTVNNEQVKQLQLKVKELQQRNTQKLTSLEASNKNLVTAHKEIKEFQKLAEERHQLITSRERQLYEFQSKFRQIQQVKSSHEAEMGKSAQQKRILQKRMEMIMQQMHGMKKRYEQEKGRSQSFTRNEEFHKVRNMESQIQKKQKNISKLSKQKLELEQQNVKMNVQVMKLLSQLQKYKSTSASNQSLKTITHSLK